MRTTTALIALLAAFATGCGATQSSAVADNDANIRQAQREEAREARIHRKLDRKLHLSKASSYDRTVGTFKVPNGGLCIIDGIYVGGLYGDEPNEIVSPDFGAAVQVATYEGTRLSVCMTKTRKALGW